jgi:hypothetical protein
MGMTHAATPSPTTALSSEYEASYDWMLSAIAAAPGVPEDPLAVFWPMIGHAYQRQLMVIGKAVNGWIDDVQAVELTDPVARENILRAARRTSEGEESSRMRWVTASWGNPGGYSTARSAFWRHIRAVLAAVDAGSSHDPEWSSRLVWSNLAKLAPAGGGNPGGPLLEVQRRFGPELLKREIEELQPLRVLVLTGRWWFDPFVEALGLPVEWRTGFVQGVASDGSRRWVIASHPQGKPRAMTAEIIAAFTDDG